MRAASMLMRSQLLEAGSKFLTSLRARKYAFTRNSDVLPFLSFLPLDLK